MALRALLVVVACALLVPGASGAGGRVITEHDSGKTFTVRQARSLALRLSDGWRWVGPRVKGKAVRLVKVDYFADPGFLEWEVDARLRGSARISAVGYRQDGDCNAGSCAPRKFRVTIVVR
jgi:hypothetical protein